MREMSVMKRMRAPCPQPRGATSSVTWVAADGLESLQGASWQDAPARVLPQGDHARFGGTRSARGQAAGPGRGSLLATAHDMLANARSRPELGRAKLPVGLGAEREAQVLAAWHRRAGATAG